jgi:SAM-dependent methyltransferase
MKSDGRRYTETWMAAIYDGGYQGPGGPQIDFAFWLDLAKKTEGPLLELACGTGRLAIPLAREGFQVTGLDISAPMLAVARRKLEQESEETRARLQLLEGDMSNFSLKEKFGLIFIAYRSFQALLEKASQRDCLRCCAEHLKSDGLLGINVFYPKLSLLTVRKPAEIPAREYVLAVGDQIRESGLVEYDIANQKVHWKAHYECTAPDGRRTIHESTSDLRYFFRYEMEWMLESCGFEVEALYGNFDHSPLQADSPEMIFVARKKGS